MADQPHVTLAASMEVQEYLFSDTLANLAQTQSANCAINDGERRHLTNESRSMLRLHRFNVMSWLMTNGVKIPVDLLADQNHPQVGSQYPDRPTVEVA